MPLRIPFTLAAILLAMAAPADASAQEFGRVGERETSNVPYRVFTMPGEATVEVLVLGSVGTSGIYEVGESTTLDQLLVLAGGANAGGGQAGQRYEVTIRLHRPAGGQRQVIYEALLEDMLAQPSAYPALQDGDVFSVEARAVGGRIHWRDVLQVVTSATTLAWAVSRLVSNR